MNFNSLRTVSDFFTNDPPTPPRNDQTLSTWGEAIVAAASGNAARMQALLNGTDDDGKGIDLRTFRTSYADVSFVRRARDIIIDPNYTLVEIAVERDHFDVVMALTEPPKLKGEEPPPPPPVARSVSTFVQPKLADKVRDMFAAHLEVATESCAVAGARVPLAAIGPCPLQHLQVAAFCCNSAYFFVPREVLGPQPLQHIQVTAFSCMNAGPLAKAAILVRPLQHVKMTSRCGVTASFRVPVAAVRLQPLQHLQAPATSC